MPTEPDPRPLAEVLGACDGHKIKDGDWSTRVHCPGCTVEAPRLRAELERLREENKKWRGCFCKKCGGDAPLAECINCSDDSKEDANERLRADLERKEAALRAARDWMNRRVIDFYGENAPRSAVTVMESIDSALGENNG